MYTFVEIPCSIAIFYAWDVTIRHLIISHNVNCLGEILSSSFSPALSGMRIAELETDFWPAALRTPAGSPQRSTGGPTYASEKNTTIKAIESSEYFWPTPHYLRLTG
jgi:hypothetical protein